MWWVMGMRDIPLKYKFWLVNAVSFAGMVLLSLFTLSRGHDAVVAAGKKISFASYIGDQFLAYAIVVLLLMLGVLAASQMLIAFVERHITVLHQAMLAVQHQHDLNVRVDSVGEDEVAEMGRAFNAMQDGLLQLIRQIDDASGDVRQAVDGMRDVVLQTQQGMNTQQQKSSDLEHRVQEMLNGARTVLQQATQTQQNSGSACELAQSGSGVVRELTEAFRALANDVQKSSGLISKLAEDSKRIGAVLNVIREIADQTNLLALNAAIEAARAGDSGRGFAVVADEVRQLARRAGESTDEIRQIVEALQQTTRDSVELMAQSLERANASQAQAERAAHAITTINESVRQITDNNRAIADVSQQQAELAERVYHDINAIKQITDNTRQSTQLYVQNSDQLNQLSARLQQSIGQFRIRR